MHANHGKSKMMLKRLAWCAAVLFVMNVPCSASASGHGASAHGAHGEEESANELDVPTDLKVRGIELGEFRIKSYYPVEAQKSTVRFILHVSVASDEFAQVKGVVSANEHKMRDQIIIATRMTPLAHFDEPGLENFRRRIYLRLLRAVPGLQLKGIHISEFQLTIKSL